MQRQRRNRQSNGKVFVRFRFGGIGSYYLFLTIFVIEKTTIATKHATLKRISIAKIVHTSTSSNSLHKNYRSTTAYKLSSSIDMLCTDFQMKRQLFKWGFYVWVHDFVYMYK
jgi:hypothetical protein